MKIRFKDIIKQLYLDLIGKDSHRGVTLTYAWLANQFGHFGLGFIPSIILILSLPDDSFWNRYAAVVVAIFWLVFELYNFLGPLLLSRVPYVFKPKWANIGFDTITDLGFFWIGAGVAGWIGANQLGIWLLLPIGGIIVSIGTPYWFKTKIYVQEAVFPYQLRLSQWFGNLNSSEKPYIQNFINSKNNSDHLLVFGQVRTGKTKLAVGIGTEMSIAHNSVLYITGMRILTELSVSKEVGKRDTLWNWKSASTLVIDDINPGHPGAEIITPKQLSEIISASPQDQFSEIISRKKVVWVLGDYGESNRTEWVDFVHDIGVSEDKIRQVVLAK